MCERKMKSRESDKIRLDIKEKTKGTMERKEEMSDGKSKLMKKTQRKIKTHLSIKDKTMKVNK